MARALQHTGDTRGPPSPRGRMRHMAFLEALVAAPDDGADWRGIMAGLLVLRLVDAWRDDPGGEFTPDAIELAGARDAVDRVPAVGTRTVLGQVIDAVERRRPSPSRVAEAMLVYGRDLMRRGTPALAEDVLATAVAWRDGVADVELRFDLSLALESVRTAAVNTTRDRESAAAAKLPAVRRRRSR